MQSTRATLRFGASVRFRDSWQGRLSGAEVEEDWRIVNLILIRGLFRKTTVRIPFVAATDWDDEVVAIDATADEAFGRRLSPAPVTVGLLSPATPLSVRGFRLAGVLVQRSSRCATHLLVAGGPAAPLRMIEVRDAAFEGGVLALAKQPHQVPIYRTDAELALAVRDALAAHRYLTADDRRRVDVEVVDGVAYLTGNVRTPLMWDYVQEAASSVQGLQGLVNRVVDDRALEVAVGRALDARGFYRQGRLYVRASQGDITLGGFVGSEVVKRDIERVAAQVEGVRSVVSRIEVSPRELPSAAPPPLPMVTAGPTGEG